MFFRIILLLASAAALLPASAWQERVNVRPGTKIKQLPATHLRYELSWNGRVKAGTVDLKFGLKDPRYQGYYVAQGWGGATGWASALYPFTFSYTGFLNPKTLRPVQFHGVETERGKKSTYKFRFRPGSAVGTKVRVKRGKSSTDQRKFTYQDPLDLFSGVLQVRSLPLQVGQEYRMPFQPVGRPYLAVIKVRGKENHLGRPALRMEVSLLRIAENGKLETYEKLKSSTLWLSDDAWKIPLEVRAKVYVGDVRMRLVGQELL